MESAGEVIAPDILVDELVKVRSGAPQHLKNNLLCYSDGYLVKVKLEAPHNIN